MDINSDYKEMSREQEDMGNDCKQVILKYKFTTFKELEWVLFDA